MSQTFDRICSIIHCVAGVPADKIKQESSMEQLTLNPLDVEEVIMDVEEEFDVLLTDENGIETVNDLVRRVDAELAATA